MSVFCRLLLATVLAMLPLRGMAAAIAVPSDAQNVSAATAHAAHGCCDHVRAASGANQNCGGEADCASCSDCAACCLGSSVTTPATSAILPAPVGALVIAFLDRRFAGFVPELFDRPPLAR